VAADCVAVDRTTAGLDVLSMVPVEIDSARSVQAAGTAHAPSSQAAWSAISSFHQVPVA
jgi:hypothetical protein